MTTLVRSWRSTIPDSWEWTRLSRVATMGTGHTPDRKRPQLWEDVSIPWVTAADLSKRPSAFDPLESTEQQISEAGLANSAAVLHPPGTVMLCRTASVGLFCRIGRAMATTQAFVTWTAGPRLDSRYLLYVIGAMGPEWDRLAYGSTHLTIYFPDLADLSIPLPPLEEQRRIADFLDDTVSRIDRIIASRREQTAILDGTFPSFVTSSIDDVQPTWRRLSGTVRITDGAHVSPELDGGVYDFVSTRDLTDAGAIDFEGSLKTSPTSYESLVRNGCRPVEGDILFSKDGTVGRVALVQSDREFVVASSLIILSAQAAVQPAYLIHAMRHSFVDHQVQGFVRGAGLPRISLTNLKRVQIPVPSKHQQLRITQELDQHWDTLHDQMSRVSKSVRLLTEYKSSLITAAVTGELDMTTAGSSIPG